MGNFPFKFANGKLTYYHCKRLWANIFTMANSNHSVYFLRYYYKSSGNKKSIFHSHNYDGSLFRPIYMSPTAEERIDSSEHFGGQDQQPSTKLSNPLEKLSTKPSNIEYYSSTKLLNPLEYVKENQRRPQSFKVRFDP